MGARVGWHCTACNRYFQTDASESAPEGCVHCGATGALVRIDHPRRTPPAGVEHGATVACDVIGEVESYLVGEVVEVREGRVLVRAHDGTGTYSIRPERIVGVRSPE